MKKSKLRPHHPLRDEEKKEVFKTQYDESRMFALRVRGCSCLLVARGSFIGP